jgi:hypothetical protein
VRVQWWSGLACRNCTNHLNSVYTHFTQTRHGLQIIISKDMKRSYTVMKHVAFIESYQVCLANHVSGHRSDCPRINLVSFYENDILPFMKDLCLFFGSYRRIYRHMSNSEENPLQLPLGIFFHPNLYVTTTVLITVY